MARRRIRRTANRQYAWATGQDRLAFEEDNEVVSGAIIVGGSDISVLASGGHHVNLKRLILDVWLMPHVHSMTSVTVNSFVVEPSSDYAAITWAVIIIDGDDPTFYDPSDPEVLADERVVCHGILVNQQLVRSTVAATSSTTGLVVTGDLQARQDVKSNRRITVQEQMRIFISNTASFIGLAGVQSDELLLGGVGFMARALIKFP